LITVTVAAVMPAPVTSKTRPITLAERSADNGAAQKAATVNHIRTLPGTIDSTLHLPTVELGHRAMRNMY
jgi:hypothetical protein